jgi:hypothetical protein
MDAAWFQFRCQEWIKRSVLILSIEAARKTRCLPRRPYPFPRFAAEVVVVDPQIIIVPAAFLFATVAFMTRMLLEHREKLVSPRW